MARTYDVWLDDLNGVEFMKVEVNVDIPEGGQPYEGNLQCTAWVQDVPNHIIQMKFFDRERDPHNHIAERRVEVKNSARLLHSFIMRNSATRELVDSAMFHEFQRKVDLMFDYHVRASRSR